MNLSENSIFRLTIFIPIISVLLLAGTLTSLVISYQQDFLNKEFKTQKEFFIKSQKEVIKNEVNKVHDLIIYKSQKAQIRLRAQIKNEMGTFYNIVNSLYNQYKLTKSKEEIIEIIRLILRDLRLNGSRGYLNIVDLNGIAIMLPIQDQYEDMSILSFRDKDNKFYIKDSIKLVKEKKYGYISNYEVMPDVEQDKEFYKLNYVKLFKPLGLVLSVGEYLDNIDSIIKSEILARTKMIRFGKKGYIYIVGSSGKLLSHINKELIGKNAFNIKDINGKYYFKDGYNQAKKNKSIYFEYISASNKNNKTMHNARKLTYAKYSAKYDWVISSGIYLDDIDKVLLSKKEINKVKFQEFTFYIILLAIILSIFVMFISFILAKNIKKAFVKYSNTVKQKENELQEINNSLEKRIQEELAQSRKKDAHLLSQARFASLGEMIGNIAHQWRQPLSAISTISSGNILQNQLGLLSDEENTQSYKKIIGYVEFLSQTIDDFRNYMKKSDSEGKEFDIKDTVTNILSIIEIAYKDNNITLLKNLTTADMVCIGSSSELSQVILNILNNSKDVLIEKKLEYKRVKITTQNYENNNIVKIYDNGGGIPPKIIEKVFDPYFTTKHKSQGTGIGLYMSKDIVQSKFKGELDVENIEWECEGKLVYGACFTIKI